jgi:hypothetical protein
MSTRHDRTIHIIEYFSCRRTEEHPPESTRMRGHDDEIEPTSRDLCDLFCSVSGHKDSGVLGDRELVRKEQIESLPPNDGLILGNLGRRPNVKFKAIVAGKIHHMNQRHFGA